MHRTRHPHGRRHRAAREASRSRATGRRCPTSAWTPSRRRVPGQAARPGRRPSAAPRAGHRRAVARPAASTPPGRGCTRRRTTRGERSATCRTRCSCARTRSSCSPTTTSSVDAVEFRRLGRGGARRRARPTTPSTALAAYGGALLPEDLYEPWAAEARERLAVLHRTCSAWPVGGRSCCGRTRPTRRPTSRWPGSTPTAGDVRGGAAPAGADGPGRCAASWAPSRATPGRRLRGGARPDGAGAGAGRATRATPAGRPRRRGRLPARAAATGPTPAAAAPCWSPGRRGRQDRRARPDCRPGRGGAAGGSPVARLGGRGRLAVRPGAGGVRRPLPRAPGAARRAGRRLRRRARPRAVRPEITWSGETAHQRLFVAAAELLRLAAAGHGLLLVVDDVHEADEASLRLLHYLARCAVAEPVADRAGRRGRGGPALREVGQSLVARGVGSVVELPPLDEAATRRLLAHRFPELDDGDWPARSGRCPAACRSASWRPPAPP